MAMVDKVAIDVPDIYRSEAFAMGARFNDETKSYEVDEDDLEHL